MKRSLLAAAVAALSFTAPAPAEAMTCKQVASQVLNNLAQYSGRDEYDWRRIRGLHRDLVIDQGCDPIGSGFDVKASGIRLDYMLYGRPDPNGY